MLRPFLETDAHQLVGCANDEKVSRFLLDHFPFPYSLEDALWWIKEGQWQGHHLAIIFQNLCIGGIGSEPIKEKEAKVGYWIGRSFWGRGLATSALAAYIPIVFGLGFQSLIAPVAKPNVSSVKVLEKNGFILNETIKKGLTIRSGTYDCLVYRLTRPSK